MRYEIWQLPVGSPYKFLHYDWIKEQKPTLRDYVPVYSGVVEIEKVWEALDAIWELLNVKPPVDYHGMSLSVSDVICLIYEGNKRSWWYVDGVGFKRLDWRE